MVLAVLAEPLEHKSLALEPHQALNQEQVAADTQIQAVNQIEVEDFTVRLLYSDLMNLVIPIQYFDDKHLTSNKDKSMLMTAIKYPIMVYHS